ncbi:MAG: DNA-3-methyladenine glycosylase [Ignavibacteria bacterium]|nr:DNA-3-methyladenine glycosylase [Ignavibacteria bacterium]
MKKKSFDIQKLPRSFYLQPTITVAKKLLGKLFVRKYDNEFLIGKIVEVEAYRFNDKASHSYRGKTKRNEVMFASGGTLYVYFTYGMHFCANVVTEQEGKGCAVLLRGMEPLEGIATMKKNRSHYIEKKSVSQLTNGPAKICQSFLLGRNENGADLLADEIFIAENNKEGNSFQIESSARIGIREGYGEKKKWRFFLKNNPFVSVQ